MDDLINRNRVGHSADVRMHLFVNGHILNISHLGPDFVILRSPIKHDPADAEISLSIDGNERRWGVRLVEGIHENQTRTPIRKC